jgi:hypothetical protein
LHLPLEPTTIIDDWENPDLTIIQRVGRASFTGFEDGITDIASTALAGFVAPFGAEIGAFMGGAFAAPETLLTGRAPGAIVGGFIGGGSTFLFVSYVSTRIIDEQIWAPINHKYLQGLFP